MTDGKDTAYFPGRSTTSGLEESSPVSAAFIAAGIGCLSLGVLQFVAEMSEPFNESLAFSQPLGPYSGKYVIAYALWLVSWAVLHLVTRRVLISMRVALIVTVVLAVVAAILLFPPFIGLFAGA
ncbi:MAG: hypothetical protein C4521_00220 [Actinobacteria bacterium]|nr:MAG: hypothetical protein C4521_00220 [Actinomycetota bacterium]